MVNGLCDFVADSPKVETTPSSSRHGWSRAHSYWTYASSQVAPCSSHRYPPREWWYHSRGRSAHGQHHFSSPHRQGLYASTLQNEVHSPIGRRWAECWEFNVQTSDTESVSPPQAIFEAHEKAASLSAHYASLLPPQLPKDADGALQRRSTDSTRVTARETAADGLHYVNYNKGTFISTRKPFFYN